MRCDSGDGVKSEGFDSCQESDEKDLDLDLDLGARSRPKKRFLRMKMMLVREVDACLGGGEIMRGRTGHLHLFVLTSAVDVIGGCYSGSSKPVKNQS